MDAKKRKILVEKIEILDESTGQIILKEHATLVYNESDNDQNSNLSHIVTTLQNEKSKNSLDEDEEEETTNNSDQFRILVEDEDDETSGKNDTQNNNTQQIILIDSSSASTSNGMSNSTKRNLINSGLSAHIVQNYSILAQEITSPMVTAKSLLMVNDETLNGSNDLGKLWSNQNLDIDLSTSRSKNLTNKNNNSKSSTSSSASPSANTVAVSTSNTAALSTPSRAQKELATCQFCCRTMLKKNIPTHIRRAHTPKEELVCLNEEQNIFTFQHLKPGQRRKRSARAYDYSLMTATVSIDEDPCDGIENKFITEGEEILSTDLLQLADRVKYGISQIPNSTLTKLIDILSKIEASTQDEISANAKAIRNMICVYLTSGEEFKYKLRQVGDDIVEKKKQVNSLRADLKEVMSRKVQLERRIQPLVCELQKLEDQHGNLIDQISQLNDHFQYDYLQDLND